MAQQIKDKQLHELRRGFFDINPQEVINDAQDKGLDISTVEDFRSKADQYDLIEGLMISYSKKYASYSAIGGATTGIGGITTSIALSSLEMANTACQLYRLSQRFAILNGFDPSQPLQQDKVYSIYLNTLGFKAATQATIKYFLFRSSSSNEQESISGQLFSTLITRIARKVGTNISSKNINRLIPIVGGAIGAYTSYTYAFDTGNTMLETFKNYYFKEWHDTEPPKNG